MIAPLGRKGGVGAPNATSGTKRITRGLTAWTSPVSEW